MTLDYPFSGLNNATTNVLKVQCVLELGKLHLSAHDLWRNKSSFSFLTSRQTKLMKMVLERKKNSQLPWNIVPQNGSSFVTQIVSAFFLALWQRLLILFCLSLFSAWLSFFLSRQRQWCVFFPSWPWPKKARKSLMTTFQPEILKSPRK